MWLQILLIALAGAGGALARYGIHGAVQRAAGPQFPWGTAAVNILGCLLFGLAWAVTAERLPLGPGGRTAVFVGFLGAFTTFSTFVVETEQLLRSGALLLAGANLLGQIALGLGALLAGVAIGRWV
jgi:CrcB protein